MRNEKREVKNIVDLLKIMNTCKICRISMMDGEMPYIIPISFGYTFKDNILTLYFHGAKEGHKMDLIGNGAFAAFEMDCNTRLIEGEAACAHSYYYASICGNGRMTVVDAEAERVMGMKHIMYHQTGKNFEITEEMLKGTAVFKLTVAQFTGKCH